MSIIIDSLHGIAGLFKYAFRIFSLSLFVVEILYGLPLVAIVLWIAITDGNIVRFVLTLIITAILVIVLGLFVAFQFTLAKTISRFIESAAIGQRVFDALFDIILGISDESPEGGLSASQSIHGMSISELEDKLKTAGDVLLSQKVVAATAPRFVLWFAGKIQQALVWATVRVTVRFCMSNGPNPSIDLLALRQNLSNVIDAQVADYLKQHAMRMIIVLFFSVSLLAMLVGYGIRNIPF